MHFSRLNHSVGACWQTAVSPSPLGFTASTLLDRDNWKDSWVCEYTNLTTPFFLFSLIYTSEIFTFLVKTCILMWWRCLLPGSSRSSGRWHYSVQQVYRWRIYSPTYVVLSFFSKLARFSFLQQHVSEGVRDTGKIRIRFVANEQGGSARIRGGEGSGGLMTWCSLWHNGCHWGRSTHGLRLTWGEEEKWGEKVTFFSLSLILSVSFLLSWEFSPVNRIAEESKKRAINSLQHTFYETQNFRSTRLLQLRRQQIWTWCLDRVLWNSVKLVAATPLCRFYCPRKYYAFARFRAYAVLSGGKSFKTACPSSSYLLFGKICFLFLLLSSVGIGLDLVLQNQLQLFSSAFKWAV